MPAGVCEKSRMQTMTLQEAATKIEAGMAPLRCVASAKAGYVRVWNCYCGSIMGAYNRKLDAVCAALGMKWSRVQTAGNGAVCAGYDWEDRATFAA